MDCDSSTDDDGIDGDGDDFVDGIFSFVSTSGSTGSDGGERFDEIFGLLLLKVSFATAGMAVEADSFGKITK